MPSVPPRPAPEASTTMRIAVHGRAVDVHVPDPRDRAAVGAILRGFPARQGHAPADDAYAIRRSDAGGWTVHSGDAITHESATLDDTLLALEWQMVTDLLARTSRFHLHGASLAEPSGTLSVLILGDSGVGKTTLTLSLMASGFRPYADDVVLIDPDRLTPEMFPRAFHVDHTTRQLVAALPHEPDWEVPGLPEGYFLPATWASNEAPVGAIIVPKARGHDRALLVQLGVAEAATTLLGFSGTLEGAPARALKTAARLTASAPCYALYAGPLAATAELVAETVARLATGGNNG